MKIEWKEMFNNNLPECKILRAEIPKTCIIIWVEKWSNGFQISLSLNRENPPEIGDYMIWGNTWIPDPTDERINNMVDRAIRETRDSLTEFIIKGV